MRQIVWMIIINNVGKDIRLMLLTNWQIKDIYSSKYKNRSVTLTKEGEKFAKQLVEKYLKKECMYNV